MYEIKRLDNGRILVGIPVEWLVASEIPVLFENVTELKECLMGFDLDDNAPLPKESHYVDGSFQVNGEFLEDILRQFANDDSGTIH